MRRAGRWLWNAATALSLLVLVIGVVLSVRGKWFIDGWYWDGGHGTYDLRAVRSGMGCIQYARERTGYPVVLVPFRSGCATARAASWYGYLTRYPPAGVTHKRWGPIEVRSVGTYWYSVIVSLGEILAAATMIPAFRLSRAVNRLCRRARPPAGSCPGCGYDLRATPDRCPECGRATSPAADRLG